jgi:hypothetical protein
MLEVKKIDMDSIESVKTPDQCSKTTALDQCCKTKALDQCSKTN